MEWLEKMVRMRLIFNSMFNPLHEFMLQLPPEDFKVLLKFGEEEIEAIAKRMQEQSGRSISMGKRNCDNIAISIMEKKCVELHFEECGQLLEKIKEENHVSS